MQPSCSLVKVYVYKNAIAIAKTPKGMKKMMKSKKSLRGTSKAQIKINHTITAQRQRKAIKMETLGEV